MRTRNGVETTTCPPGAASSSRLAAAVRDVFEHLLADHDVVTAGLADWRADVEVRVHEADVLSPPTGGVGVAADLRRAQLRGAQRLEVRIHRAVQVHALPLLEGRGRL